jgi:hypothetical protein
MRHILHYSKTYPQLLFYPLRLVIEFSTVPVYCIGGDGLVVEGVGWARHSGVLNQSREVFPAQQTEDAIGVATMTPSFLLYILLPLTVLHTLQILSAPPHQTMHYIKLRQTNKYITCTLSN